MQLRVELGVRSYPVHIEQGLRTRMATVLDRHAGHGMVLADCGMLRYYGATVTWPVGWPLVPLPSGEEGKRLDTIKTLYHRAVKAGLDRNACVVAWGGGVAGDAAGFFAATYMRGIDLIQVPTTLLAMVDASVGGKVGVNLREGKNLVGAFWQPRAVYIDPGFCATLPEREMVSGLAEVIKTALLDPDPGLAELLDTHLAYLLKERDELLLMEVIHRAVAFKAGVCQQDEREADQRRQLNLGHTVGHAFEQVTGYRTLRHGEAVLLGLRVALSLSLKRELLDRATYERALRWIDVLPVPEGWQGASTRKLYRVMRRDKKAVRGQPVFVLLAGRGQPVYAGDVDEDEVGEALEELRTAQPATATIPQAKPQKVDEDGRSFRVLVLHGPNLNLLGEREIATYGTCTLEGINHALRELAQQLDAELEIFQSNHEGALIDQIHAARHRVHGILINPGAYTHYSYAIRDAIAAVARPCVEVHLSDIHKREEFRRHSVIAPVAIAQVMGRGLNSYLEGLEILVARLGGGRATVVVGS